MSPLARAMAEPPTQPARIALWKCAALRAGIAVIDLNQGDPAEAQQAEWARRETERQIRELNARRSGE